MKDTINYIIVLLSILITIIISCTDSVNNISKDQFIGMWRINENNDILHLKDNNNFILTDWTCNKLYKKEIGNCVKSTICLRLMIVYYLKLIVLNMKG